MKKKIITRFFLSFFVFLPFLLSAQGWQKLYDDVRTGYDVIESQDGNLIFLGQKSSSTNRWLYIQKTDLDGNEIWSNEFLLFDWPTGHGIIELANGQLLIVGSKEVTISGTTNGSGIFLLWTDSQGNFLNVQDYSGLTFGIGYDVVEDNNGNLFLTGTLDGDAYVAKINSGGWPIWENTYGGAFHDVGYEIELLPDGNLMILGSAKNANSGPNDDYLLKIDGDGNEIWSQTFGDPDFSERRGAMCQADDGNILLALTTPGAFNQADVQTRKIDPDGNEIWLKVYEIPDMQDPNDIKTTLDGGFIIAGRTNASGAEVLLLKSDTDGNLEWEKRLSVGQLDYAQKIQPLDDGGYAFCGNGNQNFTRMYIGRTDSQGSVYSNLISGRIVLDSNDDCLLDTDPNGQDWKVELLGPINFSTIANAGGEFELLVDTGVYEVVISPLYPTNPNTVELCAPIPDLNLDHFYEDTQLGNLIYQNVQAPTETISGYVFYDTNGNCEFDPGETPLECATVPFSPEGQFDNNFTAETDANGFYEIHVPIDDWYFPGGEFWWDIFWNCHLGTCTIDGTYLTAGQPFTMDIPLSCSPDLEVVAGTVFLDDDGDCEYDTLLESPLYDWELLAIDTTTNDTTYGSTLSNGVYNFLLGSGTYEVFVRLPNATWQTCTNPQLVTIGGGCHTGFDFPVQVAEACPLMEVDISTNSLRPCFHSTYFVQYCNLGSETATDAYIEVTLDSAMEFVSSPFPVTQDGQVLTFDLGDVEPLECQTFDFNIFLDCEAMTGLTHCVEALIFPDTTCVPLNPLWDMSSIKLTGNCEGDSVTFTLENIGTGNMSQSQNYIVIEDNVLIRSEPFQLSSGGEISETFYPEGATLRMEAGQSAFHPGNSMPSVTLEGCGTNSSGGISTGFVIQLPENDLDPFVSIECLESENSFDPNDKQGFPIGIGEGHFIRPNTVLEYKIRFQNTGTAPAVNVEIRDTLSDFLNPASLRPGVSSHAYEYELENGKVAVFTFADINLPDSTSNLEASMGFVKFKIDQTIDNQPGTQILNSAAIYFDFNPPIITNETEHQIPFPVEEQFFAPEICLGEEWMGFEVTGDTSFSETVEYAFFEQVTTYEVTGLENSFFEQNITLVEGQVFNEIVVTSDTTIIENLTAANGCDSTATTHLTVLPNSVSAVIMGLSANVYPNPNNGHFFLELDLSESMELSISLVDALGRKNYSIANRQNFAAGKNRIIVEVEDLPKGIYFLRIRSEEGSWSKKVRLK